MLLLENIPNLVNQLIAWISHSPIASSVIGFIAIFLVFGLVANEYLD